MLVDGLTKGGIGRLLRHEASNNCKYQASHDALVHQKNLVGSAAMPPTKEGPPEKAE